MVVVEFIIRLTMAILGFSLISGLTSKEPTALKALISGNAMAACVLLVIGALLVFISSASDWHCDKVKTKEVGKVEMEEAETTEGFLKK